MLRAVRDAFAVVGAGAKLWLRHWPVLLTIALFALAARRAALWAAVRASDYQNTLGVLTLVLAPLADGRGVDRLLAARGDVHPGRSA